MRNIRTFSSLKIPVFRLYYFGQLSQMVGMNMQMITQSLLVYRLTGSAAILGLLALANALPMLSLALFGGVIADRFQKKYMLVISQVGSAIVSLGVALALTFNYISPEKADSWWLLMLASIIQGIIGGLTMPAVQAVVPEMVGEKQLMNALSLNSFGMNIMGLLAPAVAGFLIDFLGFQAIYYITAGTCLIAAVLFTFMPLTGKMAVRGRNALMEIKNAFLYIRRETIILFVLVFSFLVTLLTMPYITLMPIFTESILKVGAIGMGTLISISGLGAVLGSLALASLPNKKRGVMMLLSSLIMGLALAGFAFSNSWRLSLGLIALVGIGQSGNMTLVNTLTQYYMSSEYRGRVMSVMTLSFSLTNIGVFFAGLLAQTIGVQWSVGGFSLILVVITFLALAFVPQIRKLD